MTTSLRFVCQLLTPCAILATIQQREAVSVDDLAAVRTLFIDAKQSAALLTDEASSYLD